MKLYDGIVGVLVLRLGGVVVELPPFDRTAVVSHASGGAGSGLPSSASLSSRRCSAPPTPQEGFKCVSCMYTSGFRSKIAQPRPFSSTD